MKKIQYLYNQLEADEEFFMQIKNKKVYNKILDELQKIHSRKWCDWFKQYPVNSTYLILGNWRGGMFQIKSFNTDIEVYILADYKESPIDFNRHIDQINQTVRLLYKYRRYIRISRVHFDNNFNIVRD